VTPKALELEVAERRFSVAIGMSVKAEHKVRSAKIDELTLSA
jgi:hypothetical protein